MAGLVRGRPRAVSSAREPRRLREGHARRRLDAALAPASSGGTASLETSAASVPDGDPALQRLVWERLDDALDWLVLARRAGRRARDRQPAHDRRALRPARADRTLCRALPAGALRLGTARRSARQRADGARDGRLRGLARSSSRATIAPAAPLRLRANPVVDRRRARARRSRAAPRSRRGWTSSTAATCRPRRGARRDFVPAAQLYARHARIFDERRRGVLPRGRRLVVGDERRPGDGAPAGCARLLPPRR